MVDIKLFRALSSVFLIDSSVFSKASPADQTSVLTQAQGKVVLFVENFQSLKNRRKLRDRLLNGEDVSTELEFNEIELSPRERELLNNVRPVLEKITGITGKYPWLSGEVGTLNFQINRFDNGSYSIGKNAAKRIWDKASAYWAGLTEKPAVISISAGGYSRNAEIESDHVKVGCQKMSRLDCEAVAKHYDWEPNMEVV